VEIIAPQLTVLKEFDRERHDAGLSQILRDRRIVYTFGDGREFLMRGGRKFDVVEADALQPGSAYAGNLYSYEYFCLVRDRLNPGGFGVTWSPTPRTRAGFLRAFPHVLAFGDTLVGSNEPIHFDLDTLRQRMREPFTRGWYARASVDIEALLAPSLLDGPRAYDSDYARSDLLDFNTDLFPKDEYLVSANFLYRGARAPQRSIDSPSVRSR
jgi:hypothetical protein